MYQKIMSQSRKSSKQRDHEKWLLKMGVHSTQLKKKKKLLGKEKWPVETEDKNFLTKEAPHTVELRELVPPNGTKSVDQSKAILSNTNYTLAPAYNKGPFMVVSKQDIKHIGKK